MTYLTQAADDLLAYGTAVTLDGMREALAGIVLHFTEPLTVERDRARDIAATLEQQVARASSLHPRTDLGDGTVNTVPWCRTCGASWPCPTALALGEDVLTDDELIDLTQTEGAFE